MMKRLLLLLALLPTCATAQVAETGRFQMEKTESGFVRLDRQTGAVSLCRDKDGGLTCRMAADERAAYEQELDLLEKRVTALEKQRDAAPAARGLPDESEIEQSLSIMERFMRRFMEIIEDFTAGQEYSQPAPQKT